MSVPWDHPDADPVADIRTMLTKMHQRSHERPSQVWVGSKVWDMLGPEGRTKCERELTEMAGWPITMVEIKA